MDGVLQWIRTVIIYLILVSAVMHLLPDNGYKKYVQLFTGLLLILIVAEPLADFLEGEQTVDKIYRQAVEWQEKAERDQVLEQIEETEKQAVLDIYQEEIEKEIREQLLSEGYACRTIQVELSEQGVEAVFGELIPPEERDRMKEREEERRMEELISEVYQVPLSSIQIKIG